MTNENIIKLIGAPMATEKLSRMRRANFKKRTEEAIDLVVHMAVDPR